MGRLIIFLLLLTTLSSAQPKGRKRLRGRLSRWRQASARFTNVPLQNCKSVPREVCGADGCKTVQEEQCETGFEYRAVSREFEGSGPNGWCQDANGIIITGNYCSASACLAECERYSDATACEYGTAGDCYYHTENVLGGNGNSTAYCWLSAPTNVTTTTSAPVVVPAYKSIGCWEDTSSRAIPTLEGKSNLLDGGYKSRSNAIQKCYKAALSFG